MTHFSGRVVVTIVGLAAVSGCFGPIQSGSSASNTTKSTSKGKSATQASPINDDPSDNSPVQRMTVQAESVDAADLSGRFPFRCRLGCVRRA